MLLISAAILVDFLVGDPRWFPHPVRGIGALISLFEKITVRILGRNIFAGFVATCMVISSTVAVVAGSLALARILFDSPGLHLSDIAPAMYHLFPQNYNVAELIVNIFWLWAGFSARDLSRAANSVFTSLESGDLAAARKSLSMIVGRDTDTLDETAMSRATIETVAENTVDGVLSPIFFAFVGGAPLLWVFKAASTCDSMIGYRDERYILFGRFAARLDDALNYIPARLSLLLFAASALICGLRAKCCLRTAFRDSRNHDSPNAGIPEAAAAGALQVSLGGPACYDGLVSHKKFFGTEFNPPSRIHIIKSLHLMWTSTSLFIASLTVLASALPSQILLSHSLIHSFFIRLPLS